jgi:hypothetical protein
MRLTSTMTLVLCIAAASCAGSTPAGPDDGSHDAGGSGTGGGGGSGLLDGGAGGTGGTGGGLAARACARIGSGCTCYEGDPGTTDPACTTTSVTRGVGDVGACCQDTFFCSCQPFICSQSAVGYCSCGPFGDSTTIDGPVVTACPPPQAGEKCCYSPALNLCDCSVLDCIGDAVQVPSCSLATVTSCMDGSQPVTSCSLR